MRAVSRGEGAMLKQCWVLNTEMQRQPVTDPWAVRGYAHTRTHITTSSRPASSHRAAAGRCAAAAAAAAQAAGAVAAPAAHAAHRAAHQGPQPGPAARPRQTAAAVPGSRPAACRHPVRRCPARPQPFLPLLLLHLAQAAAVPSLPRPPLLNPAARRCCLDAGLAARLRCRCRCRCRTRLPASEGSWGRTTAEAPPPLAALCRST